MTPPTPPASLPVAFAHPQRCVRKLARGEVKRLFGAGALHGYYVACPWCGFTALWLQGEADFAEDGTAESSSPKVTGGPALAFRHPRLVSARAELRCPSCRVGARLEGGQWARAE